MKGMRVMEIHGDAGATVSEHQREDREVIKRTLSYIITNAAGKCIGESDGKIDVMAILKSYGVLVRKADTYKRGIEQWQKAIKDDPKAKERREVRGQNMITKERELRIESEKCREEIEELLSLLEDENSHHILSFRYLELMTFFEISHIMNLCDRQIYRTHSRAVKFLQEMLTPA